MNYNKNFFTIFGDPVSHSASPKMHNYLFKTLKIDAIYSRYLLKDGSKLRDTFFKLGVLGANITVPHKEEAFKACDEVFGIAKELGVVNTIIKKDNKLIGYNTDADGFYYALSEYFPLKTALIIGAGGTAKAISKKLKNENLDVSILNRSQNRLNSYKEFKTYTWDEAYKLEKYDVIINTTSAGLEDNSLPAPIEIIDKLLKDTKAVVEVIYGKKTPFLNEAIKRSLPYKDGSQMLLMQGVLANHHFIDYKYDLKTIEDIMKKSFEL